MAHPTISKMVEALVKELDYETWKDMYPGQMVCDVEHLEKIAEKFAKQYVRELTDMDFDND